MRLYVFIFGVVITFVSEGIAQESLLDKKISFQEENKTIKHLLSQIQQRCNCSFNYANATIDEQRKISLQMTDGTLRDLLRRIFPSTSFQFKEINRKIIIYKKVKRYTLSGYITEKGSGEYISETSIYCIELGIGTTSNAYGFYSISVPEGTYEFIISSLGYATVTKQIVLQTDVTINFELDLSTESLEEVILTAQGESSKKDDVQMSSQKIKITTVNSLPAFLGENDVVKALQLFPGVQSGINGGTNLYVRGGTEDQNLILLDEAPVYNHTHFGGLFSVFNGDAMSSAELIKGGFGANYGGRLSSVLQVRTKNGNKEKFAGTINIGLLTSSLLLEGPIIKNRTSFVLSGRRTYPDLILKAISRENDGGALWGNDFPDSFSDVNFKMHHIINDKNKLYWSIYYGDDKDDQAGFLFQTDDSLTFNFFWGNIISTIRWNHQLTNKMFANTSLLYSNYRYERILEQEFTNEQNEVSRSIDNLKTAIVDYGLKTDIDFYPTPDHSIKFGFSSTYHNFVPRQLQTKQLNGEVENFKDQVRSLESALYVQDQWEVSDRFRVNGGIRFSHFHHRTTSYFLPEGRFSVAYKWRTNMTLKTSYAKMSQYIHRITNFGTGSPTDLWISSSEDIRPQLSDQVAVGMVRDSKSKEYTLEIEGYYKRFTNLLTFQNDTDINGLAISGEDVLNFLETISLGKGFAYGGEVLLQKNVGRLTGWMGYSYLKSSRKFEGINRSEFFEQRFGRRHNFSMSGVYKPSKKWTFSSSWTFSSGINFSIPVGVGIAPGINLPNDLDLDPTQLVFTRRNNFKGISSHRLDLGIQCHKITKRNRLKTWGISIYNVYARINPDNYFVQGNFVESNPQYRVFKGGRFSIVPSIQYSLKF